MYFPSPCREQDVIAAIKALEACAAAAIGDLRHGKKARSIKVDLDKSACFLMSAYLATIDGKRKGENTKDLIPGKTCRFVALPCSLFIHGIWNISLT